MKLVFESNLATCRSGFQPAAPGTLEHTGNHRLLYKEQVIYHEIGHKVKDKSTAWCLSKCYKHDLTWYQVTFGLVFDFYSVGIQNYWYPVFGVAPWIEHLVPLVHCLLITFPWDAVFHGP